MNGINSVEFVENAGNIKLPPDQQQHIMIEFYKLTDGFYDHISFFVRKHFLVGWRWTMRTGVSLLSIHPF